MCEIFLFRVPGIPKMLHMYAFTIYSEIFDSNMFGMMYERCRRCPKLSEDLQSNIF